MTMVDGDFVSLRNTFEILGLDLCCRVYGSITGIQCFWRFRLMDRLARSQCNCAVPLCSNDETIVVERLMMKNGPMESAAKESTATLVNPGLTAN
ncbi:hypothetical protein BLOT_005500 [Blomia tropicalis]|nr:hypothetical protein BLOT_005500 [Blomia tropicalis]